VCAGDYFDAATRRADEFNLRAADVDSLIDDKNIDLILNLTIPAAHFDVSMRALSAGKHVFTEKQLGVTAAEGRRLVDAA
ncbi:Gfo/Idh/MocA family oxidoreductase, partial [Rhizobium ruizarguesonis]